MLAAHRGTADAAGVDWKSAVYRKVKEEMNAGRGLTVGRMAQLGHISRASFYRFDENIAPGHNADMELRDAIQRIALQWPSYGRPRITAELRRRGCLQSTSLRSCRTEQLQSGQIRRFVLARNGKSRLNPRRL